MLNISDTSFLSILVYSAPPSGGGGGGASLASPTNYDVKLEFDLAASMYLVGALPNALDNDLLLINSYITFVPYVFTDSYGVNVGNLAESYDISYDPETGTSVYGIRPMVGTVPARGSSEFTAKPSPDAPANVLDYVYIERYTPLPLEGPVPRITLYIKRPADIEYIRVNTTPGLRDIGSYGSDININWDSGNIERSPQYPGFTSNGSFLDETTLYPGSVAAYVYTHVTRADITGVNAAVDYFCVDISGTWDYANMGTSHMAPTLSGATPGVLGQSTTTVTIPTADAEITTFTGF